MSTQPLLRFLAMVERELGAARAEVVLTEHPPEPHVASAAMLHGFRVEVQFSDPNVDLTQAQERLETLVESFAGVLAEAALPAVREVPNTIVHTLEDALLLLVHRARAESAWVIDDTTPEIWGSSFRYEALTVPFAQEVARIAQRIGSYGGTLSDLKGESMAPWLAARGITGNEASELDLDLHRLQRLDTIPEGAQLRVVRAIAASRSATKDNTVHTFERRFAGIYTLLLVFEGPYSELHAEAAALRALPTIEKLVTSLPPRDPVPQGAKVARLRRLRRV